MKRIKRAVFLTLLLAVGVAAMITVGYAQNEKTNNESMPLPAPVFLGGTKAITLTPVVGTRRAVYTR